MLSKNFLVANVKELQQVIILMYIIPEEFADNTHC